MKSHPVYDRNGPITLYFENRYADKQNGTTKSISRKGESIMSNYATSNHKLLKQQFRQAYNNYSDAKPLSTASPAEIKVPLNKNDHKTLPVVPKQYRELHLERIRSMETASGVLCIGNEDPSNLAEIGASLDEGEPLVYAEVDPEQFENVLENINLVRLSMECDLQILFEQSVPDLLLRANIIMGEHEREAGQFRSLFAPALFSHLLAENTITSNWINMVIQDLYHNQYMASETEDINWEKRLEPTFPYKKILRLLEAGIINSPGIKTLYEESVEPHGIDGPEPVEVAVMAGKNWETTQRCIESVLQSNLPENTNIILANDGTLSLGPERIDTFRGTNPAPKLKSFDGNSRGEIKQIIGEETSAETIVYLDGNSLVREENWLTKLLNPLRIHPGIGISGARSSLFTNDEDATRLRNIWIPGLAVPVSHAGSHCLAVRRKALVETSGWSQDRYGSDMWRSLDLQWRLRDEGWIVAMPGEAPLVESNQSTNFLQNPDLEADRKQFRKEWGSLRRIVNTARSNDTAETYQPITKEPSDASSRTKQARRTA